MKEIEVHYINEIPDNFTGIVKIKGTNQVEWHKIWYQNGNMHRPHARTLETSDSGRYWLKDGLPHREDGPAIETADGTKKWFQEGVFHREDGPAIINCDGSKFWFERGRRHRKDGPAIEHPDGYKEWIRHGMLHRLDGPAVEKTNGKIEYWINSEIYTKQEFDIKTKLIQKQLPKRNTDYKHLTDEQWYEYLNILVIK